MHQEMRSRHMGIAAESWFCLQMWKWVNKIIQFVEVSKQMAQFGISDLEGRMERA